MTRKLTFLLLALSTGLFLQAQSAVNAKESETVIETEQSLHSVKRATLLALIPGGGQAYNRKYWKVPLAWALIGGAGYYYYEQNRSFNAYKDILLAIEESPNLTTRLELEDAYPDRFDRLPLPLYGSTSLQAGREAIGYMESYRKQREYAAFAVIGVYALTILDANVDAHLFHFDVSDNLTVSPLLRPSLYSPSACTVGFAINLHLP